ncbi:MAG: DMT family transporter [Planctomycetota bacterium]
MANENARNEKPATAQSLSKAPPPPLVINLSIGVLCAAWGSTWIVIAGGLSDLPPLTSAGARFVLAGIAMAIVAAWLGRHEGGASPPARLWVAVGTLNFAVSYGIVYYTETLLPSGLVSLLWGIFPMMVAFSSHYLVPGERLSSMQWLGFLAGLVGLVLLFFTDLRGFGAEGMPAALILLLSPLASVVGNTLTKLHGGGVNSLALNRNGMLLGAALLCGAAAIFERDAKAEWTTDAILSIVYLALVGTVLTFGLYFWLLRSVHAHRLSLISYITPVIALFLGWFFRNEPITRHTLMGAACVLCGVVLVARGGRKSTAS